MIYLGVDGGGTKTAFMLINETGQILSCEVGGGSNYVQIGFEQFKQVLKTGITNVCNRIGINPTGIQYSFLGIPAYNEIKEDVPEINRIISDIIKNRRFVCGNDVEAGWAGSLACRSGINIVAGTGSIGFGRDQSGNEVRSGGWGAFFGDEGSAYWLGKRVISLFTKEADGRLDQTPIYHIVRKKFNIERDMDFIAVVYDQLEQKRDKIAGLALLLYEAALAGDKHALAAYQEAANEYWLMIRAIISQLNFSDNEPIRVSYSGGVFNAGKMILSPFKKVISGKNIKLIKPRLKPITGAALFALVLDDSNNIILSENLIANLKKQERKVFT